MRQVNLEWNWKSCRLLVGHGGFALLIWVAGCGLASASDSFDVGTSVIDITPDYPIRLNGFGNRREESAGVSQAIYAKALAIAQYQSQGQSSPLVLVTLDSLGIRQTMVDEVARRLMESHQLPAENLAVTFTHSHCTPKVNGAADNIFSESIPADHQQHIDRYTEELTDRITLAAQQAMDRRTPALLEWAVGSVSFAKNRRTAGGPVDHDLPMLVVRDPETKKPRAIYVSYACHCVTLSFNQISGDWAGYAAAMIERQIPGVVAMVSMGAGSDQNPISGVTNDQVQIAESQGVEIAGEVQRLLSGKLRRIEGQPRAVRQTIPLPLNRLPTREELIEQTSTGRPTDRYNASTQLQRLDRGEPLLSQIDYAIQSWAFGDTFCMTFLAGEVCVDYSLRLKATLDRNRFWLNAYSNDFCCYIPSERLVVEGGYGGGAEVPYFALPTTLAPGLEQKIVDEVLRQVPAAFHVPAGTQGIAPKTPEDSLECMQTSSDLQVLLVAAEPEVTDPVAIDFGPDGRLWVAEMNDYGRDVYESFSQSGRIRSLSDRDGDGYFETAHTFVDGLRFPTDVKVWRDGVLICDAPDILFARDTDGDGNAESVQKLYSGFEVKNAQARVNGLQFGLDQWVYGASGLFGGMITSSITGQTVDCSNRDFRIHPDTGEIEAVSGRTQQGRVRNDWGDWFGCSNGTLLRSIASDEDYEKRNPLALPQAIETVRIDAEAEKLYPPDNLVTFELSGAPGRATSACGLGIYRDVLLGDEYLNDAFTCEPVHQSVHRIDFHPGGDAFIGTRGREEASREFLSSTDRWFRPVQARTGPDGALWIVDMYRYVIEHSRWIPQASLAELDVHAGQGRGRIYRVLPREVPGEVGEAIGKTRGSTSKERSSLIPNLAALSDNELAAQLDSTNGPLRDLTHQMLLWRNATGTDSQVRDIALRSQHPAAQIQALAVLDGLKQLSAADLLPALNAAQPDVQRFALKLSERFVSSSPELLEAVNRLASSDDLRVRRQAALSLGAAQHVDATRALARLLGNPQESSLVMSAALNSVSTSNLGELMRELARLPSADRNSSAWQKIVLLAIQTGDPELVEEALTQHLSAVGSLPTGSAADQWVAALNALDARASKDKLPDHFGGADRVRRLFRKALETLATDLRVEADERGDGERDAQNVAAIRLLGRKFGAFSQSVLNPDQDEVQLSAASRARGLVAFLSPRYSELVQEEAMRAMFATGASESATLLVQSYPVLSSKLRASAVDMLLGQAGSQSVLLAALEDGTIPPGSLDAGQRDKLLSASDAEIRSAAERVLGASSRSSRSEVVESILAAVDRQGSASSGRTVFRKHCSSCHRLEEQGYEVGPDLRALTNRDPKWLLTAILDPNQEVDARYLSWTALMTDGRMVSGMIVEETATAIRLRESGGKEHLVSRGEIESMRSQKSVMPEGIERDLSAQNFSDVIAYLGSLMMPPKPFPGNNPQIVKPNAEGVLRLTAAVAEIRGTQIQYEIPFGNVGYWHDQSDSVTWQFEITAPGDFDVYLDASCDSGAAGNQFRIDGLREPIVGRVASTGGWDQYRQHKVGITNLNAGRHAIMVQAAMPLANALFDLREIRLVPAGGDPGFVTAAVGQSSLPRYPAEIAPFLLDESQSIERRQAAIDQRPGMGPAIIGLLVEDLDPRDEEEAYRRIPWIWRVAIAVAKRNDGGEIRDLLEIAVPKSEQPLRDWQAVVIGGGLINGISQAGVWPGPRLNEILNGIPSVHSAWSETLEKAARMADNEGIRSGTRYDALRMVALRGEADAIPQLLRYLGDETSRELQMGAVSGLVDMESEQAIDALSAALPSLEGQNRQLAIDGLSRTESGKRLVREHVNAD